MTALVRVRRLAFGTACAAAAALVLVYVWRDHVSRGHVRGLADTNVQGLGSVLDVYDSRISKLTIKETPWYLFHAVMGRMEDFEITDDAGVRIKCLEWLCREASWKPCCEGLPLIRDAGGLFFVGRESVNRNKTLEDHFCQFLWILSECGVDPSKFSIRVPPEGRNAPLTEFVASAEDFCDAYTDLSWALPVIARWGRRPTWANRFGEEYSVERLLEQHLERERPQMPCFDQHWRMGLALGERYAAGRISRGLKARVRTRLEAAVEEIRRSQDASGRFRLEWGVYPLWSMGVKDPPPLPSEPSDIMSHHGHALEWLMVALSDEELARVEWPHKAAAYAICALSNGKGDIQLHAHAHCVHGLRLYEKRVSKMKLTAKSKNQ